MKHFIYLALAFMLSCETPGTRTTYTFPPEWEPHEAVWMAINDAWGDPEMSAWQINTRLELANALQQYVPLKVVVNKDSLANAIVDQLYQMGADTTKITTIVHPIPGFFMRDTGPIFLSNGKELKVANWQWECLAKYCDEDRRLRGTIDDSLSVRFNYPVQNSSLQYDGGGIVVNHNSALSIKEYALEKNKGQLTLEAIEKEILGLYGKEQMIWLEGIPLIERKGLKTENYFGMAADGHIDALIRFANDSTLLVTTIAEEDKHKHPIAEHDYELFQNYLSQLKQKRRTNGKPFHLIEIPSPDPTFHQYSAPVAYYEDLFEQYGVAEHFASRDSVIMVPPLSYANYLVTNGAVFVAQYWEEGMPSSEKQKDKDMVQILETYFPGRKIVGFKAKDINWYGGGIHCVTQQEPKIN